jgi:nucleoside-diphosphate-sugar epimerase
VHDLHGARVLVTGAAGFIGTNLVESLVADGARVTAMVRPRGRRVPLGAGEGVASVEADLVDRGAVRAAFAVVGPELVVHAAMEAGHPETPGQRARLIAASVGGTANVLDAASTVGVRRIVHVGSSLEYGHHPEPLHEELALQPSTVRGAAKAAAAVLCLQAGRDGAPVTVLRPFSVYGPWEPPTRLVPAAIRAALLGEALPLTEPGLRRDFVHVHDVARAVLLALTAGPEVHGRAFNVGTGRQTANEDLVAHVGEAVGRAVSVVPGGYRRRPVDTTTWVADVRRARRELGFEARIELREGLSATVAWARRRGAVAA